MDEIKIFLKLHSQDSISISKGHSASEDLFQLKSLSSSLGTVHKVHHARVKGVRKGVTVCDWWGQEHVTSHF